MTLTITLDERGDLLVSGIPPGSLLALLITDDIGTDVDECNDVLTAIQAARTGRQPTFERIWNATHLIVTPDGASLCIAATLTNNQRCELSLDELDDALVKLRAAIA
jgi:hypothetical protein